MKRQDGLIRVTHVVNDERGVSFMATMMITLMVGSLGVAALTMSGMENSTAGAMRMVEEGVDAAESCVGMGVRVIQMTVEAGTVPSPMTVPNGGPVPSANAVFLGQEISINASPYLNNSDVAWGSGAVPNLTMNVNNYVINGDIDKQFVKIRPGSGGTGQGIPTDHFYRIDCQAVNAATGATSRVMAVYLCYRTTDGETCQLRFV